ncbi:hypothetical protein GAC71_06300 [Bacteroides thetaiotaomicron]|nr:hypothetical protein GAC71_06300 [Bacteroides thetaiotaomicron]
MDNLLITQKYVSLHCVFHSIRFKVNKGWGKALLLFLCPYPILASSDPTKIPLEILSKGIFYLHSIYN